MTDLCALINDIFLFNQHSVSYLLASQMSSVIYLIINETLSYTTEIARVGNHYAIQGHCFWYQSKARMRPAVSELYLLTYNIISHRLRVTAQ